MTTTEDINQVKLRGTVADVFYMNTSKGSSRLSFTVQTKSDFVDNYGDKVYIVNYVQCAAWGKAADMFKEQLKQWTRVQLIWELSTYTTTHKKDSSIILYKTEIRTHKIEVIGFDDTFVPRTQGKVEFSITDDFSDLN